MVGTAPSPAVNPPEWFESAGFSAICAALQTEPDVTSFVKEQPTLDNYHAWQIPPNGKSVIIFERDKLWLRS